MVLYCIMMIETQAVHLMFFFSWFSFVKPFFLELLSTCTETKWCILLVIYNNIMDEIGVFATFGIFGSFGMPCF